ncbi:MAG: glutamate--tRNA ligase [bacterium]|nr:glutamate--tRNA ligase [bacterium]
MSVRTRFAPSPTGFLHIGGARTALFNQLYARRHGGTFVLRIEDTDRARSTPESIQAIFDGLSWLGIDWDEGPFYQTQRFALYADATAQLLANDHAYRCWCTSDELEARRAAQLAAGGSPAYDRRCRTRPTAPDGRETFTVRFKTPSDGETVVDDAIKGRVVFANAELDDFIIQRSDGSPIYNFCVVVDDVDMRMTDVIRGDDHLSNTPRQILLYQALGAPLPRFAHVPLILGLDKTRLSKRHGATSVTSYRDDGYLSDALVNFLVRLGWSHGDQELFTRAELVEHFGLEHVGASPAVFNPEKLLWTNFQWLKGMTPETLAAAVRAFLPAAGVPDPPDHTWLVRAVALLRDRARTLVELAAQLRTYLVDPIALDAAAAAKHLTPAIAPALNDLHTRLGALGSWEIAAIESVFRAVVEAHGLALGKLAQPVRVASTGGTASPGIFEVLELLGRERALARLAVAHARTASAP